MTARKVPSCPWTFADLEAWVRDFQAEYGVDVSLMVGWSPDGRGGGEWAVYGTVSTAATTDEPYKTVVTKQMGFGTRHQQDGVLLLREMFFSLRWEMECFLASNWLVTRP